MSSSTSQPRFRNASRCGDASAAERYLGFLRTGSAEDPVTQLRRAGVDMTTPAPIEKAFAVLEGYVTQLEELADARA